MNMEVKSVGRSLDGFARKRRGTKAHLVTNASPPPCSTKKNRMFSAIKAYVTSGTVLREVSSSPIGSIGLICFRLPASKEDPLPFRRVLRAPQHNARQPHVHFRTSPCIDGGVEQKPTFRLQDLADFITPVSAKHVRQSIEANGNS